jgi:hypothetical protein
MCLRLRGFSTVLRRLHGFVHFLLNILCGYLPVCGDGSTRPPNFLPTGPVFPHCRTVLSVSSFSILVFPVPPAAMSAHDAAAAVGTDSLTRRSNRHTWHK